MEVAPCTYPVVSHSTEDAVNEGVAQRRNLWTGYGLKRDRDTLGDGRLRALVDGENVHIPPIGFAAMTTHAHSDGLSQG
jgi:hypothetical protein